MNQPDADAYRALHDDLARLNAWVQDVQRDALIRAMDEDPDAPAQDRILTLVGAKLEAVLAAHPAATERPTPPPPPPAPASLPDGRAIEVLTAMDDDPTSAVVHLAAYAPDTTALLRTGALPPFAAPPSALGADEDLVTVLTRAISEPQTVSAQRPDETHPRWATRAVLTVLEARRVSLDNNNGLVDYLSRAQKYWRSAATVARDDRKQLVSAKQEAETATVPNQ